MSCCNGAKSPKPLLATPPTEFNSITALKLAQENGSKPAEASLVESRISSCKACPYFDQGRKLCNRCGCLVVAKVGKAFETCPIRRW